MISIFFDTFWHVLTRFGHVFETFLTPFWHVLTRFDTRLLFDTFWHVLTRFDTLEKHCVFLHVQYFLIRFDTLWHFLTWLGRICKALVHISRLPECQKNMFLTRFDTFWHETSSENDGFVFWHAGACKHFLTRGFFWHVLTRTWTPTEPERRCQKIVSKRPKTMVLIRFDTFWHECEHLWSQSRVFGFWHVLTRGGRQ